VPAYALEYDDSDTEQSGSEMCYVGGQPSLPAGMDLPKCDLCKNSQTFYFQVAFPGDLPWAGLSVAVFACTSCADQKYLIPQLLQPLKDAEVPGGFLIDYQVNFRFAVFETRSSVRRTDYEPRIGFRRWRPRILDEPLYPGFKLGGVPAWELEDESPKSYNGEGQFAFLMQVPVDSQFAALDGSPPQMLADFTSNDPRGTPSLDPYYELFVANAVYMFGTLGRADRLVYAVVQSN
jgi:hypothetical protein